MEWTPIKEMLPAEGLLVQTKIDDAIGCRNERPLERHGAGWALPDHSSMRIYHTPTHWAYIEPSRGARKAALIIMGGQTRISTERGQKSLVGLAHMLDDLVGQQEKTP